MNGSQPSCRVNAWLIPPTHWPRGKFVPKYYGYSNREYPNRDFCVEHRHYVQDRSQAEDLSTTAIAPGRAVYAIFESDNQLIDGTAVQTEMHLWLDGYICWTPMWYITTANQQQYSKLAI